MKILFTITGLLLAVWANSQGISNNHAHIVSGNGSYWVVDNGDFALTSESTTDLTTFSNLKIESGASLSLSPATTLVVEGALTNNADTLGIVLQSDGTGTAKLINNTGSVKASVEQYFAKDRWHYYTLPVEEQKNANPLFLKFWVLAHDESQSLNNENTSCWTYLNTGDMLSAGTGYGSQYSQSSDNDTTVAIAGTLVTGDKTINTAYSGEGYGWNLVGNPYPCTIDWNTGITKTNIGTAFYIWDPVAGSYASYNGTIGNPETQTQYIAPMQGFFVRANAAGGSLTFTNDTKTTEASTFKSETVQSIIRLAVSDSEGRKDETVICTHANATDGFDVQLDAYKLKALTSPTPQLYSVYNGEEYSINAIPEVDETTVIPLRLMIKTTGRHTLSLTELSGYNAAYPPVLLNASGELVAVGLETNAYTFEAVAGETTCLLLAFAASPDKAEEWAESNIFLSSLSQSILVGRLGNNPCEVAVYNANGQRVYRNDVQTDELLIPVSRLGMYLVRVKPEKRAEFNGKIVVR